MKEYRRIFISFARSDAGEAATIANDLKEQGFEVWDYALKWKKDDLGYPPPDEFVELMQRATWFIPIVSAASVSPAGGKYAVRELEYALEHDLIIDQRIVPVLLSGSRPKKWLKPFDALEPLEAITIDTGDMRAYLQGIAVLCRRLNVSYKPIVRDRPFLPFWHGFTEEIEQVRTEMEEAWKLMPVITEFDQCWEKGKWQEALDLIAFFLCAVRYGGTMSDLASTWIVKAACEFETGQFASAEESIRTAARVHPGDPAVSGAMGYLHLHRKEYAEARERLNAALAGCEAGDLRGRLYYLRPLIERGAALSIDNRNLVLEADPSSWSDEELSGLLNAGEILHFQSGEYEKTIDLFESARERNIHDTVSVIYAHLSCLKLGRRAEAETVLTSALHEGRSVSRVNVVPLYYYLAEQYFSADDLKKTLPIYEKHLLRPEAVTRRHIIRYAQILRRLGDKKRMRTQCIRMLGGMFPSPKNCEDFYYDGFAQYLLGNTDRAQYDFERSRHFDSYYAQCVEHPAHGVFEQRM
ncbi:MAG: TIR domain-containing protein [Chitinispirillaceae bacterium]|nr:TIR domain-containing protein [Chitinispirillaceae bacterium]